MEFDWDEGNRDKNLQHGVHDDEIEEALEDRRAILVDSARVKSEQRYVILGRASGSGKYLRVVLAVRMKADREVVRPISAVEMSLAEKRRYRRRL